MAHDEDEGAPPPVPQKEKRKAPSEVLKRGYSDDEILHIYELGRLCLENGDVRRAEAVLGGLTHIAPDFAPAWLGMSYIHIQSRNYDAALQAARQAHRLEADSGEAMLFMISCLLTHGDYNSAGTYLGEVGERIDSGLVDHPNVIRFYRAQLARYQNRGQ